MAETTPESRIKALEDLVDKLVDQLREAEERATYATTERFRANYELWSWRWALGEAVKNRVPAEALWDTVVELLKRPEPKNGNVAVLTPNEYQDQAMKFLNPEVNDQTQRMVNAALGLAGEAGEVADLMKKAIFQGHQFDPGRIADELGDILWYVALGAKAIGLTLEQIMRQNIAKLSTRYPEGFDSERSQNRQGAEPA